MLSEYQSQIETALKRGGLAPDAATEAASAMANCAASLAHRGPLTLDYTPKDFRFITPALRQFRFPAVDNKMANPDYRPPTPTPSERPKYPGEPTPEPQQPRDPFDAGIPQDGGDPPTTNMQPQALKVVKEVYYDSKVKKYAVVYMTIWAWPVKQDPPVYLQTKQIRCVTGLKLDNNKLYFDYQTAHVIELEPPLPKAGALDTTTCEGT